MALRQHGDGTRSSSWMPYRWFGGLRLSHAVWPFDAPPDWGDTAQVMSLRDGSVVAAGRGVLDVIESPKGALLGFFAAHESSLSLYAPGIPSVVRWTVQDPFFSHVGVRALVPDAEPFDSRGRVVLVRYSGIATGAWIECRRLSDGALVRTADVARLHVSHSEYWNSVRAWLRGDTVVLVGIESRGGTSRASTGTRARGASPSCAPATRRVIPGGSRRTDAPPVDARHRLTVESVDSRVRRRVGDSPLESALNQAVS